MFFCVLALLVWCMEVNLSLRSGAPRDRFVQSGCALFSWTVAVALLWSHNTSHL